MFNVKTIAKLFLKEKYLFPDGKEEENKEKLNACLYFAQSYFFAKTGTLLIDEPFTVNVHHAAGPKSLVKNTDFKEIEKTEPEPFHDNIRAMVHNMSQIFKEYSTINLVLATHKDTLDRLDEVKEDKYYPVQFIENKKLYEETYRYADVNKKETFTDILYTDRNNNYVPSMNPFTEEDQEEINNQAAEAAKLFG